MITIQAGKMIIPEEERLVGFAGDNLSNSKQLLLPEQHIYGRTYSLYLRFDDGRVTSADLAHRSVDGGTVLTWDIARENLLKSGIVMAQLKVADSDGVVTHYGADYFLVAASAEIGDDGADIDMLSRTEFEERMAQAVSDARATAPYIGADGYWYVYSPQQGQYVRSVKAVITVDSAVSASSANPVENRAVKAYVDAADSVKVDKTRRIAGVDMQDDITASELRSALSVPTKTSDLTNDSGFLTTAYVGGKEDKSDKVTTMTGNVNDDKYPSVKAVDDRMRDFSMYLVKSSIQPVVPVDNDGAAPDMTSSEFGLIRIGQIFACLIDNVRTYWMKEGTSAVCPVDSRGKMNYPITVPVTVDADHDSTADVPMGQVFKYDGDYYIKNSAATPVSAQYLVEYAGNKVTSIDSYSTDMQYPSAKCVFDMIGDVESVLASLL